MSNPRNPNFPDPSYQDKKEMLKILGRETYAISEGFAFEHALPGYLCHVLRRWRRPLPVIR